MTHPTDISQAFEELKDFMYERYCGVLIERTSEGFKAMGKTYASVELAKQGIDEGFKSLQNSIR